MQHRGVVLAATILLVAVHARYVRADVVAVTVHGAASESERQAVVARVFAAGRAASWQMDAVSFTDDEIIPCFNDVPGSNECITPAAKVRGVAHLIVVRIEREKGDVKLTELFVTPGHMGHAIERYHCAQCRSEELLQATSRLAEAMIKETAVTATSEPPGATITLDNKPIAAGVPVAMPPGTYAMTYHLPGYVPMKSDLVVQAGRGVTPLAWLTPLSVDRRQLLLDERRQPPRWNGGLLSDVAAASMIVGGVALVAGGSFAIVAGIDDKDSYPRLTGIGVGGVIAGAAVLGWGIYLGAQRPRANMPSVNVTPRGAMVGWSKAF